MLAFFIPPIGLVAPREGAWIEIPEQDAAIEDAIVAPREGAWIEIFRRQQQQHYPSVAPREGRVD